MAPKRIWSTAKREERWLLREQAVLLLMADHPGPAVLHGDGKAMKSKRGRSLYRVRVPIRYGQARRGMTP